METVVDNDLILKSVSYGLAGAFWPHGDPESIGILGAAKYVVGHEVDQAPLNRGADAARSDLSELLARCEELEPTDAEIDLAAQIELCGQEHGLALDNGESQLAAIVVIRNLAVLETGDKRAIEGFEEARCHLSALEALRGRVRCLEQIARRAIGVEEEFDVFFDRVCAESGVDKSLSVCLGCFGDSPADRATAVEALDQYIREVRRSAPEMLIEDD
ncbi:MAG: hypothetical protein JSU06_00845 [Actinobacteria bacterium]|nr:hypothetical protein [Actinomycetota bacterium]